ncbi:MAG: FtsX-like permease family protein [Bacteroidia bacterium]|nr:FtsX-like permease family protein [Bacteroidia bacterium]
MKEDLKIAWRNLWRNKRRTIITSASVFFAVFFAVIMRSYQLGSYDRMILNFIESYSGYLQVQNIKYQDNPSIDYSFDYSDSLAVAISGINKVVSVSPHIESFALASSGTQTKGVIVLAIDPEKEKRFSNPENKLVKYRITNESMNRLKGSSGIPVAVLNKVEKNLGSSYSSKARLELELGLSTNDINLYMPDIIKSSEVSNGFLTNEDDGVLVSDRLASCLKITIGDTVILMGQGYHGASAAGIFPVRGVIKMPSPEIDNKLIIMTITAAQKFFDEEGKITSLSVNLTSKSSRTMRDVQNKINLLLTDKSTLAKTWEELNPVLVQQIQGDSQTGIATLGMLYFIIFFGIFGTVLMMIAERTREFGVLIAIGMQKKRLKRIVTIEMILIGIQGLIGGLLTSTPVILYFYYYPIVLKGDMGKMMEDYGWDAVMPTAWFGPYFYWQAIVVCIMVFLATIYPLRKIGKLKEIEALRS